jgi:hypothetical protein
MATQDYQITNTLLQSLFEPSPEQKLQAYQKARDQQAMQFAQLSPGQGAVFAGAQLAQDLGKSAGELGGAVRRGVFGIQTPKEIEDNVANQIKAKAQPLLQQGDVAGYADFLATEYAKAGLTDRAVRAKTAAEQFKLQQQEKQASIELKTAQTQEARAKAESAGKRKPIEIDLGDRIEFRDPETFAVLQTVKKGLTPEQQRKADAGAGEEKAGFIGKTGAYRNIYGEVIPGSEMSKQRKGFQSAEDLLQKLNSVDYTDVVNAESIFDYASGGELKKGIGGKVDPKTVAAQTKIAASQLLQQINSLPPGSASDADMRQAAKEFPGYGNAENLKNWINRTKSLLQASLERQSDQYGFSQRVKSTGDIGPKKTKASQQQPTQGVPAGVDPAVWAVMTPQEKALWK